jgi:hypothetical protein
MKSDGALKHAVEQELLWDSAYRESMTTLAVTVSIAPRTENQPGGHTGQQHRYQSDDPESVVVVFQRQATYVHAQQAGDQVDR